MMDHFKCGNEQCRCKKETNLLTTSVITSIWKYAASWT